MDMDGKVEYGEFIAATLETRERIETERIAEAFEKLDVEKTGCISKQVSTFVDRQPQSRAQEGVLALTPICMKIHRKNLRGVFGEHVSERELDDIIEEVVGDEDGLVSYAEFMGLFGKKAAKRMTPVESGSDGMQDDLREDEEDLVDAMNVVIPGGRHDATQRTLYVYDAKRNSVRRCDGIEA
jgi:Ca2+-binding EF-hand superfamily protein